MRQKELAGEFRLQVGADRPFVKAKPVLSVLKSSKILLLTSRHPVNPTRVQRPAIGRMPRGFTLVELMAVVVIVGILGLLAVAGFRNQSRASKTGVAAAAIEAIKAAEESYRADNHRYLNVSLGSAWYPGVPAANTKHAWDQPDHSDYSRWSLLGAAVTQPQEFGYLVKAGGAGNKFPDLALTVIKPTDYKDDRVEPWYVIQAYANSDGDTVPCEILVTSLNKDPLVVNQGE